jgi:hypothetical protein
VWPRHLSTLLLGGCFLGQNWHSKPQNRAIWRDYFIVSNT